MTTISFFEKHQKAFEVIRKFLTPNLSEEYKEFICSLTTG
jgi:hypothetical protein